MRKALTCSIAALTAVSAVAFSTSAAADHYRYHDDDDGNEVGAAILGGVLGFALGAAVGSSSNRSRYGSYGYNSSPYYGGSYGSPYGYGYGSSPYYGGSYGSSPYYGGSGYGYGSPYYGGSYGGYGYNSYGYGCRTQRVYDRYYGRYVTRQVC